MLREDTAIAYYSSLHPTDYHDLERFELRQMVSFGVWDVSLEVEMRPKNGSDNQRLILLFEGVRNLKYIPSTVGGLYFAFIQIVSIADRYWEDINYQVFESEQDTELSFICREFHAKIISLL